jgi:uncharacterized protein
VTGRFERFFFNSASQETRAMKIAIVGAGISGLVAAHRLRSQHEITLFESASKPGGHTNTVRVELDREVQHIDTGFIVFNEWTYPNFIQLLAELGVESQPTVMGFSVSDETSGLEYAGQSLNSLFAQRRNLLSPHFYRMLADILRFNRESLRKSDDEIPSSLTVGEFLRIGRYSKEFAEKHLLPMGSAIWSCPIGTFEKFPIRFILEFYRNHGLLRLWNRPIWRVVKGGSQKYVDALTAPFRDRIRLNSPVTAIVRRSDRVGVAIRSQETQWFDHVVFACHSDQALRILGEQATPLEREVLNKFPYGASTAVLHTDVSLLPRCKRAWASWNYRLSAHRNSQASVTYNMNLLQGIRSRNTFCVTLNDASRIDPKRILGEWVYHHPIFTVERDAAQARHRELLTANRTSFCGAYWRNGFHEDGVVSALAVVDAINALDRRRQKEDAASELLAGVPG